MKIYTVVKTNGESWDSFFAGHSPEAYVDGFDPKEEMQSWVDRGWASTTDTENTHDLEPFGYQKVAIDEDLMTDLINTHVLRK